MINRKQLCHLAVMALPHSYTNLVWAQQGGVSMIVVFVYRQHLTILERSINLSERERRHPYSLELPRSRRLGSRPSP